MSYTKTNWANSPSTTTPLNATNMNKIEDELALLDTNKLDITGNALIYKGTIANNTDLNSVTTTGMYYITNVTVTNGIKENYQYSILMVVNVSGIIQQYIVKPSLNVYEIREYSGSPAAWGAWKKIYFNIYSGTERIVGTWVDGKPIYKKTVTVTNTAFSAGDNTIAHGVSNLSQCIKVEAVKAGSHMFPYINLSGSNTLNGGTFVTNVDSTNITIRIFNDSWGSGNTWYFTLYYTKTTD